MSYSHSPSSRQGLHQLTSSVSCLLEAITHHLHFLLTWLNTARLCDSPRVTQPLGLLADFRASISDMETLNQRDKPQSKDWEKAFSGLFQRNKKPCSRPSHLGVQQEHGQPLVKKTLGLFCRSSFPVSLIMLIGG